MLFQLLCNSFEQLVPKLMSMKADSEQEKENSNPQCSGEDDENDVMTSASYINERGEDYQEQIGMPDEENMRSWSHHYSTDTIDDPIFRAAMRGYDAVSFLFGLEVTWGLIQQRQQEEEERQAMLELEKMDEIMDAAEAEPAEEELANNEEHSSSMEIEPAEEENKQEDGDDTVESSASTSECDADNNISISEVSREVNSKAITSEQHIKLLSKITVGTKLSVYWPDDNAYYPCETKDHCPTPASDHVYTLRYEDGETETVDLATEKFRIEESNEGGESELMIEEDDSDNAATKTNSIDPKDGANAADEEVGEPSTDSSSDSSAEEPAGVVDGNMDEPSTQPTTSPKSLPDDNPLEEVGNAPDEAKNTWECPSCTFGNKLTRRKVSGCNVQQRESHYLY